MRIPILLGTHNPAKQNKLRWLLKGLDFNLGIPDMSQGIHSIEESGSSHKENAIIKAVTWSRINGGLAIASDGGLVIPVLGSEWNSLKTRRFIHDSGDDNVRAQKLLALMRGYKGMDRAISWIEALAIANSGSLLVSWVTDGCAGILMDTAITPTRHHGFWVASLWLWPELGKTWAEATDKDLARVNDPWNFLKSRVQRFLRDRYQNYP